MDIGYTCCKKLSLKDYLNQKGLLSHIDKT